MVYLDGGRGQLAAVLDSPRERVEARINRAGGSPAMVEVDGAEANHRAEGTFPDKSGQLQRQIGVRPKLQPFRTGSLLVLVNHERAGEAHAVVAQTPLAMHRGKRRE